MNIQIWRKKKAIKHTGIEGQMADQQLECEAPEGPPIRRGRDARAGDDLWREVLRGAREVGEGAATMARVLEGWLWNRKAISA